MSTISKEAMDEARRLYNGGGERDIAAALQRHMDATARGDARAEARAEEKEALAWDRDQLLEERDEALRERDEARRVARSLARWLIALGETMDPDLDAARAYPEKP